MKNFLTILLFSVNFLSFSQWTDNFTDGDFTNAPTWQGQSTNFEIDILNQLHLIAPAVSDTSYLSTPSTAIENASWEFYVEMDFGTSGSNLATVYLTSNNSNLKGPLNGYFVMIGNTSDEVSLYKQTGTSKTKIINGIDGLVGSSTVTARVKVTRDNLGNWELSADNTGGSTFVSQGTVLDNTFYQSSFTGVYCKYTSTRSTKFYFDDFIVTGSAFIDNISPSIQSVYSISNTEVDVLYSENMEQTSVETLSNYNLDNSIGNPISAIQNASNSALVHLTFSTPFTNNTSYFLTTENVDDLAANTLINSVDNFLYFVSDFALVGDVLITEVMADFSPIIGLPEEEYIEIYNNSAKTFDLNGWIIGDAASSVTLTNYILGSNEYVLLTNNGVASQFGIVNTLEISLPSFNNSGDAVTLKSDAGLLLDSIYYDLSWYNDSDKDDGGWSLERKRLSSQCSDKTNWSASTNSLGGTPGFENSVFSTTSDISAPIVSNYTIQGDTLLIFEFDENIVLMSSFEMTVDPMLNIISTEYIPYNAISIQTEPMQIGVIYTATLSGTANCWTTEMNPFTFKFGLPDSTRNGDVIINEIMFNPATGGSDYIEIVNISDKILSLKDMKFANIDDGIMDNIKPISSTQRLFLPGDYFTITKDSSTITTDFSVYGIGRFIDTDLPTYPNDSGTVILLNVNNQTVDRVHYDEDYHFDLLTNTDGKALERISLNASSDSQDNWHTASEVVEWGTPGYQNSQFSDPNAVGDITIETAIFSPDNDGYQDVLLINYQFTNPDNVMDITIHDTQGRLIKELKDNFYPGMSGLISWDGIDDNGTKASVGSYIVLFNIFDLEGNTTQYKKAIVLATRL